MDIVPSCSAIWQLKSALTTVYHYPSRRIYICGTFYRGIPTRGYESRGVCWQELSLNADPCHQKLIIPVELLSDTSKCLPEFSEAHFVGLACLESTTPKLIAVALYNTNRKNELKLVTFNEDLDKIYHRWTIDSVSDAFGLAGQRVLPHLSMCEAVLDDKVYLAIAANGGTILRTFSVPHVPSREGAYVQLQMPTQTDVRRDHVNGALCFFNYCRSSRKAVVSFDTRNGGASLLRIYGFHGNPLPNFHWESDIEIKALGDALTFPVPYQCAITNSGLCVVIMAIRNGKIYGVFEITSQQQLQDLDRYRDQLSHLGGQLTVGEGELCFVDNRENDRRDGQIILTLNTNDYKVYYETYTLQPSVVSSTTSYQQVDN